MNKTKEEELREEFEEWYGKTRNLIAGPGFPASSKQIADFFLSKFASHQLEMEKRIAGLRKTEGDSVARDHLFFTRGYNSAVDDIINLMK